MEIVFHDKVTDCLVVAVVVEPYRKNWFQMDRRGPHNSRPKYYTVYPIHSSIDDQVVVSHDRMVPVNMIWSDITDYDDKQRVCPVKNAEGEIIAWKDPKTGKFAKAPEDYVKPRRDLNEEIAEVEEEEGHKLYIADGPGPWNFYISNPDIINTGHVGEPKAVYQDPKETRAPIRAIEENTVTISDHLMAIRAQLEEIKTLLQTLSEQDKA